MADVCSCLDIVGWKPMTDIVMDPVCSNLSLIMQQLGLGLLVILVWLMS